MCPRLKLWKPRLRLLQLTSDAGIVMNLVTQKENVRSLQKVKRLEVVVVEDNSEEEETFKEEEDSVEDFVETGAVTGVVGVVSVEEEVPTLPKHTLDNQDIINHVTPVFNR